MEERWGGKAWAFLVLCCLGAALLPVNAKADIYKCTKAGQIAYQETPCEGANVQSTHIEERGLDQFIGCFATTQNRLARSFEVRASGAGAYELIDEGNPLGSGIVLKQATSEELAAVSDGLRISVSSGLSRRAAQMSVNYSTRVGNRYVTHPLPVAQPITAGSLYGIYRGSDSAGKAVLLLHTGGGIPQSIVKIACPSY